MDTSQTADSSIMPSTPPAAADSVVVEGDLYGFRHCAGAVLLEGLFALELPVFLDMALLFTLVGMWTESRLLISMQAIAILLPQTIWVIDFLVRACGGHLLGMTDYMFNPSLTLFTRGLSLFHGWLPFLLVYLLIRLGYDRRAYPAQCAFGISLLLFCFFFAPKRTGPRRLAEYGGERELCLGAGQCASAEVDAGGFVHRDALRDFCGGDLYADTFGAAKGVCARQIRG